MDPQGYDAGKKVAGRKRHTLVAVHPADIQDRDGVAFVLNASTRAAIRARVPPPPANGSLKSSRH
jgi:hypothetical protein